MHTVEHRMNVLVPKCVIINFFPSKKATKIKKRKRNIFGGGSGGGLALNYNHNVHKYHKYHRLHHKSEDHTNENNVKKSGGSQSFDEATTTKQTKIFDTNTDNRIGGMSMFDNIFSHNRQRALSSESISIPSLTALTPTSRSKSIKFSKDDDHRLNGRYYAGSNSPRMTHHLFDLKNMNEFIATKDAISVVTNSFTLTHDDHFKFIENHF